MFVFFFCAFCALWVRAARLYTVLLGRSLQYWLDFFLSFPFSPVSLISCILLFSLSCSLSFSHHIPHLKVSLFISLFLSPGPSFASLSSISADDATGFDAYPLYPFVCIGTAMCCEFCFAEMLTGDGDGPRWVHGWVRKSLCLILSSLIHFLLVALDRVGSVVQERLLLFLLCFKVSNGCMGGAVFGGWGFGAVRGTLPLETKGI